MLTPSATADSRALKKSPNRLRGFTYVPPPPYDTLLASISCRIPADRLITDPLRLLTWGTDASFHRLVPKLAVVVESEEEVIFLLAECARLGTPVTFRAAGTSLSGQAVTDSVLLLLGNRWRRCQIGAYATRLTSFVSTPLQDGQTKMSSSGRTPSFEIVRKCFMVSPQEKHTMFGVLSRTGGGRSMAG
jgi:hypothetical protein